MVIFQVVLYSLLFIIITVLCHYLIIGYKLYCSLLKDENSKTIGTVKKDLKYVIKMYNEYQPQIYLEQQVIPTLLIDYLDFNPCDIYLNKFYIIIKGMNIELKYRDYIKYIFWLHKTINKHKQEEFNKWKK